ncbi:glycosyltransferase family 4 protein [Maribacter sp. R77961]|uniref:glycosyltransferase family 4 protein n=1 Tax=Maribacter sp. R77961 TaxID=3093871 RepID=UPI0037C689A1
MNSSKKNIAFYIHDLGAGGAERVVVNLCNSLKENYNVYIITNYNQFNYYKIETDVVRLVLSNTSNKSKGKLSSILENFKRVKSISKFVKKYNINLLIGFTTHCSVLAILAARRCQIPVIVSERSNPNYDTQNIFWSTLRKFSYPLANKLIVQNKGNVEYFKNLVDSRKIKIILNPISEELRKKLKDNSRNYGHKNILNVGRLDNNKAQDLLIRVFANLNLEGWTLTLVGDGNKKEEYQNLVKQLNVTDKVKFIGRVKNVSKYYFESDIFAFTSKSEGLPNALMEALYYGLACISTNCPFGPEELITHGENGFLIPVENQNQLEVYIMELVNKPDLIEKMGKEASIRAKKFEIENIVLEWVNEIESLVQINGMG